MKKMPLANCDKFALVDDEDYERLSKLRWNCSVSEHRNKEGDVTSEHQYAVARILTSRKPYVRKFVRMHRMIMNAPEGLVVDHIDRNGLNNQKENLRLCTRQQNNCNSKKRWNNQSGYKGVHKACKGYWEAAISVNGKIITAQFKSAREAALAYDKMAIEHYGEFALLNFPDRLSEIETFSIEERRNKHLSATGHKNIYKVHAPTGKTYAVRKPNDKGKRVSWGTYSTLEEAIEVSKSEVNPLLSVKREKYIGVYKTQLKCGRISYYSRVIYKGIRYSLGSYDNETLAARAYDKKVLEFNDPTIKLNFPDNVEVTVSLSLDEHKRHHTRWHGSRKSTQRQQTL